MSRLLFSVSAVFIFTGLMSGCQSFQKTGRFDNAVSADGTTIAYEVYGDGEVTLAFVHGWSCDSRYWRHQVSQFARNYRVVTIDLAGHGNSGMSRQVYTMKAFGEDVATVLEDLDAQKVILAGHSMGGSVILHAAQLAPDRVIGLIGVDTLQDMQRRWSDEQKAAFYDPLAEDFKPNAVKMVESMMPADADPALVETIAQDMSSAPPAVALSAMRELMKMYDSDVARDLTVPIKSVNADLWPTNPESNREVSPDYEVAIMEGFGHFIQLEAPEEFNRHFERMVQSILSNLGTHY